ncbi:MAG: lipoprotein [Hyphomonas sp.]
MKRILGAAALVLMAASLPACGLTGDLKRPAPLFGSGNNVDPANLPDEKSKNLPDLPDRPSQQPEAPAEDELLGGPDS